MSEAARYPNNDSAESRSIKVLQSLLDEEWVKDQFEKRDKKPNTDGTIELVDIKDVPIGKLDVQIKTLPSGSKSFRCSSKLFAYSKVTTAPLLLICVDADNNRAYWKHIHPGMKDAKGKGKQKGFVVKFDGSIDATKGYIIAWESICEHVQSRLLTGGSCLGLNIETTTAEGFKLHPRWDPDLRHVLLPLEKNKKELKAALKYAHANAASGWADFISELQTLIATNNANPNNSRFQLNLHPSQLAGSLQYKTATLFFQISGTIVTLEFRLDGKLERNEGEVSWYLPKKVGSPGKLNWFELKKKNQSIGTSQRLAEYCITRLTGLCP